MIEVFIAQLNWERPIWAPPISKWKLLVVAVLVGHISGIEPVISRVVDDHVKDDANRERLAVFFETMSGINELD
jgi:hypothetical protein